MKTNQIRNARDAPPTNYRQSVSILSSELVRNSLSGDSIRPNIYRESLNLQAKSRNTMNLDMIEHLRR